MHKSSKGPRYLPGDRPRSLESGAPGSKASIEAMIRVDQAGEYGAKRIYEGQLAVLGKSDKAELLTHMAEQEAEHLAEFDRLTVERRVRPTALTPIWHMAGYALGYVTARMGEKAAMACTVAVEETIDKHYQEQIDALPDDERELKDTIERFRQEELEHRDIGLEHGAENAAGYPILSGAIKRGSKLAIWLSERI